MRRSTGSNILRLYLSGMALIILISCFVLPSQPAYAGRMIWTPVDTPSNAFNVIVSPSEVSDLVAGVDGRTFYAVDTVHGRVYRSDDACASWIDLTGYLITAGAVMPAWQIAVAQDNSHFIAAVTSTGGQPRSIFISSDGGQTWNNSNFPATANIGSIAISPFYGNYDIAAGTRSGGAGSIYVYKAAGMGGSWAEQGFTGDVLSLKFSPSYRTDVSLAVIYSTPTGTFFNVGVRDLSANTTSWSVIYSGSKPEITISGGGTSAKFNQVITGDLELPSDFSGQSASLCRAYVSIDAIAGSAGIFRIDNSMVFQLLNAQPNRRISSIAFFGMYLNGKLLAGEVTGDPVQAMVPTWYTDAPMTCPATCWYRSDKSPTGAGTSGYGNARVLWSVDGSRAYCGTSSAMLNSPAAWPSAYTSGTALDESAISVSRDNGHNWNQISLIDTQINYLSDVAVKADSSIIYLATVNNSGSNLDSIWVSSSASTGKSWERVLCFPAATNDIILRTNNYINDQAIFIAARNTDDLRLSQDGGQTWKSQLPGMKLTDFSVTSLNNISYIFILGGGYIRKGKASSPVTSWSPQVATMLLSGHSIFAAPNGVVVVGGDMTDNRVAFSIDAGNSFNVTAPLPVNGNIHTIVDYRMRNTFLIYAATDDAGSDIYVTMPGAREWQFMGAPAAGFWSVAQVGTLYGASFKSGIGAVCRTLSPESLGPPAIEWDLLNTGLSSGVAFTREPISLKLSSGVNLWAIDNRMYNPDTNTGRLWTFCDCLAPGSQYLPMPAPSATASPPSPATPAIPPHEVLFAAPIPYAPRPDDLIPIFINDNSVGEITFRWRQSTPAIAYELWLSEDMDFSKILMKTEIRPENRRSPSWTITDKKGIKPGGTYYWKIRVVQAANGEKDTGIWSDTQTFTVAENESNKPQDVITKISKNTSSPAADNQTDKGNLISMLTSSQWVWQTIAASIILIIALTIALSVKKRRI